MDIGSFLDRAAISPRVHAADKRAALSVIADAAARALGLKAPMVLDALLKREEQGSTGGGQGVATPHAQIEGLDRVRGVFVRLETPVDFGALDDQPVDLLFTLLAPPNAEAAHLRALALVSRVLRQGDVREQLRQASGQDAIRALLVREAQPTAA